jgi:gliding motility-associated-like protein
MKSLYIFISLLFGVAKSALAQCDTNAQRAVLRAFYDATDGAHWADATNWGTPASVSTWFGIKVVAGCVTELNLPNNQLSGIIPDSIGQLRQLKTLNLYKNQLNGSIPLKMDSLTQLTTLNLSNNQLTGAIPNIGAHLKALTTLNWSKNQLAGKIPDSIGAMTALKDLNLSNNQLSDSIPQTLGLLKNLLNLNLSKNQLTGTIPNTLADLKKLITLHLAFNELTGNIPDNLGDLPNLDNFYLFNNELTGNIPNHLGQLGKLKDLRLHNNNLTGSIPDSLKFLTQLRYLHLYNNELTGSIPLGLGRFNELLELWLYNNQLTGSIPDSLGNLSNLKQLNVSNNQLTGQIPASFRLLTRLVTLDFKNNQIDSVPNLSNLRSAALVSMAGAGNKLTFDDIVPNNVNNNLNYGYNPQDSFSVTTARYEGTLGSSLTIDLGIDIGIIPNSIYTWSKKGIPCTDMVTTRNQLIINNLNFNHGGIYTCKVTNAGASSVTLYSKAIEVVVTGTPTRRYQDSLILVDLYHSTRGMGWANTNPQKKWNCTNPMDTWFGITLDSLNSYQDRYVKYIILPNNSLAGAIPPSLGNLAGLERLYLQGNQLSGCFPENLRTFCRLQPNSTNTTQTGYNFNANSGLPWAGNFSNFCNGLSQTALTCDDNNGNTYRDSITASCICAGIDTVPSQDSLILVKLYHATKGSKWINHKNWLKPNQPISTWFGVTLNAQRRVEYLDLQNNQLRGKLHDTLNLHQLSALKRLYLNGNLLSGKLPDRLNQLSNLLTLHLYDNSFTGNIPTVWSASLVDLRLSMNQLTGTIPPSLGNLTQLVYLILSNNFLKGTIPMELGRLSKLSHLDLSYNQLTGTISDSLSQDTLLTTLLLHVNGLTGGIPTTLSRLSKMTYLNLSHNKLTGSIPNSFGQIGVRDTSLSKLGSLHLYANTLTGGIPPNLGNLANLVYLNVGDNPSLGGTIPNNLSKLSKLEYLGLYNNKLTDSIPSSLGKLTNLQTLSLSSNQLTKRIPDSLGYLVKLQHLHLNNNELIGKIPNRLGKLDTLQILYLNNNQLTDSIPDSLGYLRNLQRLYFSNNQIIGKIPIRFQNLRKLNTLFCFNNRLDSMPDLSMLPLLKDDDIGNIYGLRADLNKLTFSDILPNMRLDTTATFIYHPQDSIYKDTTFRKNTGDSLSINLGIDSTIPDNIYKWFKNNGSIPYKTIDTNRLIFNRLRLTDAGLYTCQVTNLRAPALTLYSRKINIQVTCAPVQSDSSQKPLCGNRNYRLPSGKIVNRIGTFLDTVRSKVDTICDSIRYKVVLVKDSSCRCQDSLVLVALYRAAHDTVWAQDSNWLTLKPIHTWFGVRVNTQGCVDSILLYQNKLKGILPDSMGQLTQIRYLNLYDNQLTDSLRPSLGNLRQLKGLVLGKNNFTKSIPARLGNLAQLGILHLAENQLVGTIPIELGRLSQLIHLYLYRNQLTDTIPASLGDLSQLEILDLGINQLKGRIPTELGRLVKLKTFSLRENQLTGTIPESLGNLSKVGLFFLFNNQLTGSIPQTLGRLDNLQDLELQNNRLTGSIPDSLSRLKQLSELALFNNYLSGNIPDSFSRLVKLQFLLLHHNQLTGKIPDLQRLDSLKYFEFQGNRIDSIPKLNPLTNFPNLISFRADTNKLTFDDIVPNLWRRLVYTPQDSIYKDTTFRKNTGDSLIINLGIDSTISDNNYKWFKRVNGTLTQFDTIIRNNKLIFNRLRLTDTSLYTCQVTNPNAPSLTLYSRKINIQVTCAPARSEPFQAPLCGNRSYRLPSGRIVNSIGIFQDTVRSKVDLSCDSIRYAVTLVNDTSCRCQDSLVLVTLYNTTTAGAWNNRTTNNWCTVQPLENWKGIRLNAQGCVDSIDLNNNNLSGVLKDSLSKLTHLTVLSLGDNKLTGLIPDNFGNLSHLTTLHLYNNQLTGKIPSSLGNLDSLRSLALNGNQLSDSIPSTLGRLNQLDALYLDHNNFTGSIPNSLTNLTDLQTLTLNHNRLTGKIPTNVGRLTKLVNLYLNHNYLNDTIPPSLGVLTRLENCALQRNAFKGTLPSTFQGLRGLKKLEFHSNFIDSMPNLNPLINFPNLVSFKSDTNKLTFDDILPNLARGMTYQGQDFIYAATSFAKKAGDSLIINLGIDDTVTTNVYTWFKTINGTRTPFDSSIFIRGNKLIFNGLRMSDAGIYTCQVTNPNATSLTLYSRNATIQVTCPTTPMTHYLPALMKCNPSDTSRQTQTFKNRFGCDSIVIQPYTLTPLAVPTLMTYPVCDTMEEKNDTIGILRLNRCDSVVIHQYRFDVSECIQNIEIHDWLIPNDNDGRNDFFHILYINRLLNNRFVVFDFQGELVYQTVNYNNDWGGTDSKGNPLPAGLYRYVFSVPNPKDGKMLMRKGVIRIDYVP